MHDQHHSFEVEQEQPDNRNLAFFGVIIIIVFFGSGAVLTSMFWRVSDTVVQQRSAGAASDLVELRAKEEQQLTSYGWVDKDKQLVRVPIDHAMKLMVEGDKK